MEIRAKTSMAGPGIPGGSVAPGGVIEVEDAEGARLCEAGMAEPVAEVKAKRTGASKAAATAEKRG